MHRRGSVKAMILLACPLKLHPTLRYIKIACKAALGRDLEDPYVAAAKAANSVTTNNPIAYLTCLRPYFHLLRKIISVRRKVHLLQVPIVAVHSSGDEIVSKKSLEYFYRLDNSETYIVSESGHFLYSNIAKDRILHSILTCLEKN